MDIPAISVVAIFASFGAGAGLMVWPLLYYVRRNDRLQSDANEHIGIAKEAQGQIKVLQAQIKDREDFGDAAKNSFRLMAAAEFAKAFEPLSIEIKALEQARAEDKGKQGEQINEMLRFGNRVSKQVGELSTALNFRPQVRGKWGEDLVEGALQASGMVRNVHYLVQKSNEAGRPDFTVRITRDPKTNEPRELLLDSKVSKFWWDYYDAKTEDKRDEPLAALIAAMRNQAKTLGKKNYEKGSKASAGFVVMVVPDPALHLAMEHAPDLFDGKSVKGVQICGYTTLLPLIKVVQENWQRQKATAEAKRIVETGKALFDNVAEFSDKFAKLMRSVRRSAIDADESAKSFVNALAPSAQALKELGISSSDDIETPQLTEHSIREVPVLTNGSEDACNPKSQPEVHGARDAEPAQDSIEVAGDEFPEGNGSVGELGSVGSTSADDDSSQTSQRASPDPAFGRNSTPDSRASSPVASTSTNGRATLDRDAGAASDDSRG